MKVRNASWRFLAVLSASATFGLGLMGCEHRNPDINRVQPGYVRKAIFETGDEWYYRRTIAKSETTNAYIIEGHGDIALDRVKFDIQEDVLIAYKPYEAIPGAQTQEYPGNTFFKGTVLAAWPIESHFDIVRGYDALTGNPNNEINENAVDRVWHERDYMRVNWANNQVERSIFADYSGYWFPVNMVSTGEFWTDLSTRPTDPYASRFHDDYVEVTDSVLLGMDLLMCAAFVGYSWAGYGNCGFGEAKVRHSFVRIKEASDYIPVAYPDSVVRKDANGDAITDPETGEVLREGIYNRFGIFRIETPTYDRGYGHTESGRLFRAMLFNIWKRHTDDNGRVIPERDRDPKPIVYYVNSEYPDRYRQVAAEVAADYNRIYSNMVADVKGISFDQVQDLTRSADGRYAGMFQIRENDCNRENIVSFVSNNPDYLYAVERAACGKGSRCSVMNVDDVRRVVGIGNLETVCTSLESATLDPSTGESAFQWQRIGDNRYNMVVWLNNPQRSRWGGYGPMHADARTGETVAATSFLRGWSYEVAAANVVDYIEFMNDEKSVSEVIYGKDIRRQVAENLRRKGSLASAQPGRQFLQQLDQRIFSLGTDRRNLLREVENPRHLQDRLERIRGTRLEDKLIHDLDIGMATEGKYNPITQGRPDRELLDLASPAGRMNQQNPMSMAQRRARAALGRNGFCFIEQDFDPHFAGLAHALRNMPRERRYEIVAARLVKHVMLHELGHNVGLTHNFEGSYDALNYNDQFWDLHWASDEEKVEGAYDEHRHTTVMEYLSSKGLFGDHMGRYDEAAIRFAYANQVQVFDSQHVDPALQGGEALKQWRYYADYRKIPDHLCGGNDGCGGPDAARDALRSRRWVEFNADRPPQNEVPYLFCDNYYDRMTPFCATFDFGSNLREIFANYYSMWSDYFFFNNFIRDRLTPLAWSPTRAMFPVYYTYMFVDTVAQYFYYLNVTDPTFRTSDLREDMAATLAHGLNMAAEIISTPEPRRMCPWPGANPPVYLRHEYLNDCDEYAPIDGEYAVRAQAIHPPLGDARPAAIGFTEDYEEWDWSFVGSYFDKSNVMFMLGFTQPTLFRFNYDLDMRNYFISLYRLFEEELKGFYHRLMTIENFFIRADLARDLGSYWCRDPESPGTAHLGYYEPKKMIDLETGAALPGPSGECRQAASIYPTLLANMPFTAMFVAHALFSSDFDYQVDMGKEIKVYVRGADDDYAAWSGLPNCTTAGAGQTCYCSMTDILTGLEYRAIQPTSLARESAGCRLVRLADDAQRNYLQVQNNPYYHDNWRQWIERLEYARDLYRLYHMR